MTTRKPIRLRPVFRPRRISDATSLAPYSEPEPEPENPRIPSPPLPPPPPPPPPDPAACRRRTKRSDPYRRLLPCRPDPGLPVEHSPPAAGSLCLAQTRTLPPSFYRSRTLRTLPHYFYMSWRAMASSDAARSREATGSDDGEEEFAAAGSEDGEDGAEDEVLWCR